MQLLNARKQKREWKIYTIHMRAKENTKYMNEVSIDTITNNFKNQIKNTKSMKILKKS